MARLSRMTGPRGSRRHIAILAVICVVLLLLDLTGLRYGYLDYEKSFGGWALTAFAAALAALGIAALLRPLLTRTTREGGDV